MEDTVYACKGFPSFVVPHDWLMEWENIGQKNVTVLSHKDHFLTATSRLFEMLYDMGEGERNSLIQCSSGMWPDMAFV